MLYVDFKKPRTIREFLQRFFGHKQLHGTWNFFSERTFFDKELKGIQCNFNRRRSFDEIHELVNTYYSNVSKKKLLHILITLDIRNNKNQKALLNFHYCSDIKKSVISYMCADDGWSWQHLSTRKQKCQYSWKELMLLLGIHNLSEFKKYQKKFNKTKKCKLTRQN